MNIYIPEIDFYNYQPREIFILVRPFILNKKLANFTDNLNAWGLTTEYKYTSILDEADVIIFPMLLNSDGKSKATFKKIKLLNIKAKYLNKQIFCLISGDFGFKYPKLSNVYYFRLGGFKSQLDSRNISFPFSLSDHYFRIFQEETFLPLPKKEMPVIGFCGHATLSQIKRFKEVLKFIRENTLRLIKNPLRKDLEPLFPSAYYRAILLKLLEDAETLETNFIYRNNYRAGAITEAQRKNTTLEYYNNLRESDYIVCLRGGGNFSVRLYETLMMGKIPVFINTDCILPFDDTINWKKHVVWVEWKERDQIVQKIINFHNALTHADFIQLQYINRQLWLDWMNIKGVYKKIETLVKF